MTTLSLEPSRAIHALIGDYECENWYVHGTVEHGYEGEVNIYPCDEWAVFPGKPDTHNVKIDTEPLDEKYSDDPAKWCAGFDEIQKQALADKIPAPTFAELIRVLPRIGEKKGWLQGKDQFGDGRGDGSIYINSVGFALSMDYMNASTEEEGMKAVEEYLMTLLK